MTWVSLTLMTSITLIIIGVVVMGVRGIGKRETMKSQLRKQLNKGA